METKTRNSSSRSILFKTTDTPPKTTRTPTCRGICSLDKAKLEANNRADHLTPTKLVDAQVHTKPPSNRRRVVSGTETPHMPGMLTYKKGKNHARVNNQKPLKKPPEFDAATYSSAPRVTQSSSACGRGQGTVASGQKIRVPSKKRRSLAKANTYSTPYLQPYIQTNLSHHAAVILESLLISHSPLPLFARSLAFPPQPSQAT